MGITFYRYISHLDIYSMSIFYCCFNCNILVYKFISVGKLHSINYDFG